MIGEKRRRAVAAVQNARKESENIKLEQAKHADSRHSGAPRRGEPGIHDHDPCKHCTARDYGSPPSR
jgi:hypothetical protein